MRLAIGSTIGRRIRTSHFDDENEPCSSFGVRRHYKTALLTLRFSTADCPVNRMTGLT
jgi:hypothetical protein